MKFNNSEVIGFDVKAEVFDYEENDFDESMGAIHIRDRLIWNEEGAWIYVADLPSELIKELKQQPFYAATHICECYLNDIDIPINDGYV